MKQLIKIFFVFILLYILGQSLGIYANKKLKLGFNKYYFFIGIIILLGLYEILMFVPLLYNFSSIFMYICSFIVLGIGLYTVFIERKEFILNIKNKKIIHFLIIFCLTLLIFFISGNAANDFNDTYFYESFITENTKAATLNYLNIFQSGYYYLSTQYSCDAYYHFLAFLANIFKIKPYLLLTWFSPFFYSTLHFSVYAEIIEHFDFHFNKKLLFIPIYIIIFIGLYNYFDLSYVGNYFTHPFLAIIILLFSKKELSIKQSIFLALCFFAGLSLQSTFVIYSIIIIVAKAFSIFINKEDNQITPMCIYSFPVLFYSFITIIRTYKPLQSVAFIEIVAAFVALFILFIFYKILNVNRLKYCCIIFSLVAYVFSIVLLINKEYTFGPQDFVSSFDYLNVGINYFNLIVEAIPLLIIIIYSLIHKTYNYYFVLIVVTWLLFFNPLTITFFSTYMTSVVYHRIFNVVTNISITFYAISLLKQVYPIIYVILLALSQQPVNKIDLYNKNDDYLLYRLSYESYEAFTKLDELTKQYKEKTGYPPSTFATDLRSEFITDDAGYVFNTSVARAGFAFENATVKSFREEQIIDLHSALTKGEGYKTPEYISNVIINQSLKYLLIDSKQTEKATEEIEKCCKLVFSNNSYYLYSCNH